MSSHLTHNNSVSSEPIFTVVLIYLLKQCYQISYIVAEIWKKSLCQKISSILTLKSLDIKTKSNPKKPYNHPLCGNPYKSFNFQQWYNIVSSEIINLTNILESVLFSGPIQVVSVHATHINTTHTSIFLFLVWKDEYFHYNCTILECYTYLEDITTLICHVFRLRLKKLKRLQNITSSD